MVFISDGNVSHHFEKGLKGDDFNFSKDMAYHWKALITIKRMTHRRGFYNIPGQNGGMSKVASCLKMLQ